MISGKGISIWQLQQCEGGDVGRMVARAVTADLRHVHIKVADGIHPANAQLKGLLPAAVAAFRAAGLKVWGWHFLYGILAGRNVAVQEAENALRQIEALGLDGYALDFENTGNPRFSWRGGPVVANALMQRLRAGLGPDYAIAAKSHGFMFRHGSDNRPLQPQIPFDAFIEHCTVLMPQVYWVRDTPERRLPESLRQYTTRYPGKPFIPTGSAYGERQADGRAWSAQPAEITAFLDLAQGHGLPAVGFYSWNSAARTPGLWDAIAAYTWRDNAVKHEHAPLSLVDQLFGQLQTRNLEGVVALYEPQAALVTAQRTVQGHAAIRDFFRQQLDQYTALVAERVETLSAQNLRYAWRAIDRIGGAVTGIGHLAHSSGRIAYHSLDTRTA
jgi:hypothetical protein